MHCSLEQQEVLVHHLREVCGSALIMPDEYTGDPPAALPSPHALRGKVLVKAKKRRPAPHEVSHEERKRRSELLPPSPADRVQHHRARWHLAGGAAALGARHKNSSDHPSEEGGGGSSASSSAKKESKLNRLLARFGTGGGWEGHHYHSNDLLLHPGAHRERSNSPAASAPHSSPAVGSDQREGTLADPMRKEDEEAAESEDDEPGAADDDGTQGDSQIEFTAEDLLHSKNSQHHPKKKRPKRAIPWSQHLSAVTFLPSTKFKEQLRPGEGLRSPCGSCCRSRGRAGLSPFPSRPRARHRQVRDGLDLGEQDRRDCSVLSRGYDRSYNVSAHAPLS